jgi:hypothetical protein
MSPMMHSFVLLLLSDNEHPMQNQHSRLSMDTMKSLSPAAQTLKPLTIPSNRVSQMSAFESCEFVNLRVFFLCQRFTNLQNHNCKQTRKIRKNLQAVGLVQNLL